MVCFLWSINWSLEKKGECTSCAVNTHTPAIMSTVARYKLNEPWCDSRQGQEIFSFVSTKTYRLGLGPILPPTQWVLGLFLRGVVGELLGCEVNHLPPLALRLRMNEAIPLLLLYVFMAYTWIYLYMCNIITKPT